MDNSLNVNICGVDFKNPIITASGTFSFGIEYSRLLDVSLLGGIAIKALTRLPREGNPSPRVAETYGGMLNSVGLQNPGVDAFLEHILPEVKKLDTRIIANIAGIDIDEYCQVAEILSDTAIDMIEVNVSCPNVKQGSLAFGVDPKKVCEITQEVKKYSKKPVIIKLSPNVTDIVEIAQAAQNGGADAVSLINTLLGMAVDVKTRRPILKNIKGGLSGPCIKPVALRMVYDVAKSVKIPVIGMGGISNATDVLEFILCGATAVQIGTANFIDPKITETIVADLQKYVAAQGLKNLQEIRGKLVP